MENTQLSGGAYLTKRTLERAISKGSKDLVANALKLQGYVIQVKNGWVVKIDSTGKVTRLKKIRMSRRSAKLKLD